MRIVYTLIFTSLVAIQAFAQNEAPIVIGGAQMGDKNATMEILSKEGTKGFMPPRFTTIQVTELTSKLTIGSKGLMIFDIDENCLKTWLGAKWSVCNNEISTITSPSGTIQLTGKNNVLNETSIDIKPGNTNQVLTTSDKGIVKWASQEEFSGGASRFFDNGMGGGNNTLPLKIETDVTYGGISVTVKRASTIVISGRVLIALNNEKAAGTGYVRIAKEDGTTFNVFGGVIPYSIINPLASNLGTDGNFAVVPFQVQVDVEPGVFRFYIYVRPSWTVSLEGEPLISDSHRLNPSGVTWPEIGGGSPHSSYMLTVYNK